MSSIQAEHFDLYLLDGWLPDLDGLELCRQMRSYDSHMKAKNLRVFPQ